MKAGTCHFCGCSEFDACVVDDGYGLVGCSWIEPGRTVCSACAPAAKAESQKLERPEFAAAPALARAYHRGFVVGWFGVHGNFRRNPYGAVARLRTASAWDRGLLAGEATSRQHQLSAGPLENAPRRDVLVVARRRRVPRGTSPNSQNSQKSSQR